MSTFAARTGAGAARRTASNSLGLPPAVPEQARWPELDGVFAAIPVAAWAVATDLLTLGTVELAIQTAPVVRQAWKRRYPSTPFSRGTLRFDLSWKLRDEIRTAERERAAASTAVAKVIAPLLLERAPWSAILQAATSENEARGAPLVSREVSAIARTEAAWWIRRHGQERPYAG